MTFTNFLFYVFSFVLVSSALAVVSTRKMVHAILFLILAFFNAAAIFVLLKAEFLAMLLVVVYVGAIAVLFLFVVMMLDIDRVETKREVSRMTPVLIFVGVILFLEIILVSTLSLTDSFNPNPIFLIPANTNNLNAIGNVLYTKFMLPFQLSGAVLFVAMVGAIVLTLKTETRFIKKQNIREQTIRNKANSLIVKKVKFEEGVKYDRSKH